MHSTNVNGFVSLDCSFIEPGEQSGLEKQQLFAIGWTSHMAVFFSCGSVNVLVYISMLVTVKFYYYVTIHACYIDILFL